MPNALAQPIFDKASGSLCTFTHIFRALGSLVGCDPAAHQYNPHMVNLGGVLKEVQMQRQHIASQIGKLDEVIRVLSELTGKAAAGQNTRTLSPAARKRIAAAQRKRWGAFRAKK